MASAVPAAMPTVARAKAISAARNTAHATETIVARAATPSVASVMATSVAPAAMATAARVAMATAARVATVDRAATVDQAATVDRAATVAARVAAGRRVADQGSRAGEVVIWHNPRCSKSRGTLELLRERGIDPEVVDYQRNPPDARAIEHALNMLALEPRALMRKGEGAYAELGLDDPGKTRAQLIAAMVAHPILIERPIVFTNGKAAIGRPPENVLAIL